MSSLSNYTKPRLEVLDFFKGCFVIIMMTNHFNLSFTFMRYIGTHSALFVSAAEGFFAISGFLLGYTTYSLVYKGLWMTVFKKNIIKIFKLLLAGFLLTSANYLWSIKTGSYIISSYIEPHHFSNPGLYAIQSFFGQYIRGYHDILFNYAAAIFFSPIFMFMAKKKKYYPALIIIFIIWLTNYIYPNRYDISKSAHNDFGWQIIFYPPLLAGYWLRDGNNRLKLKELFIKLQKRTILHWFNIIALLLYIFSFYYGYLGDKHYPFFNDFIIRNDYRETMGPIRVIIFYLWMLTLLGVFYQRSILDKLKHSSFKIIAKLTNAIMYFGRYSFSAYFIHFFVILSFYYSFKSWEHLENTLRSKYLADDISIILSIMLVYYIIKGVNTILPYVKKKLH